LSSILPPAPEFGDALPVTPSPETLRFLARRRSAAAVTLAAPAPDADRLSDLLRLATRVPDHGKLSPWRFIVLEAAAKAAFVERLEALSRDRDDPSLAAKLAKLRIPPLAVFVVSTLKPGSIPEWEQLLSSAVVCTNLLYASLAMGFGANWITDWYSYDPDAQAILGLQEGERIAGCVLIGSAREAPLERERPDVGPLVTRWSP
jgi:nitroreductase